MGVLKEEVKAYYPDVRTNTDANGGRMTKNEITSGVNRNIFPDVLEADRAAGVTRFRKVFRAIKNDDDLPLENGMLHMYLMATGDDWITVFAGTFVDTQADIVGTERQYGIAQLNADIVAGATELVVALEDDSLVIFADTDSIWIGTGIGESDTQEYHDNVTIEKVGNLVTITLAAGDMIANDYTAALTQVASVWNVGDIESAIENWAENSTDGTFDEATHPVVVDGIGGIYQTWTLTFTSGTAFTVSGDTVGSVGGGNISSNFAPNNGDFDKPYFTLPSAGWGGTWVTGETVVFRTVPAALPYWNKQEVPEGAGTATTRFGVVLRGV